MPTIMEATRLCKRIMLSNLLTNDYSIAVTPLLSGKHGIGKSQVAKNIAASVGGVAITIEGGTLKEGEITGIPYQYRNESGDIEFRFLPYYAVNRIQKAERLLAGNENAEKDLADVLMGEENRYSRMDLSFKEKIELIRSGEVKPVVLFFDEINRTDTAVFRELMNVILTRTVNGYRFPWWVFVMAAMNPSTQDSMYATNEMDPAQMDRFIKLKVHENADEWVEFAASNGLDRTLIEFIANNSEALSVKDSALEDDEKPTPSPRGWNMVDMIIKSRHKMDAFFSGEELSHEENDIRNIIFAKVGSTAAAMYYSSLEDGTKLVLAEDILECKGDIPKTICDRIKKQSTARDSITTKSIISYLKEHINELYLDDYAMDQVKRNLSSYLKLLDASSSLLFAQSIVHAELRGHRTLFDYLYDIFDERLLGLLQVSNTNEEKISGAK